MYDVKPYTCSKATACGPTCLKMLLEYYGTEVDLDTLIQECHVGVAGCSAKDIKDAAIAHGLEPIIYQMDADELIRQDRPAIIWWKYTHWCVFAGMDVNGNVVICNPAIGRYGLDKGTFAALYSGVSLWNGEPHDL